VYRTFVQKNEAELSTPFLLWRECQRNIYASLVYIDCSTSIDGHSEDSYDEKGFLCGSISGQDSFDQFAGCF
jgi:hypothetical protein